MANNLWSNYTEKTATPVDADEVMVRDSTDGKNKRLLFGTFWKWVAKKLNEATISELETDNKTIIGAINALNGNSQFILKTSTQQKGSVKLSVSSRRSMLFLFNNYSGYLALYAVDFFANLSFSVIKISDENSINPSITFDNNILTISEKNWLSILIISTDPVIEIK